MLTATPDHCERYLRLLGIPREEPDIDALGRIVRAQLTTVPFESISKLYYLKTAGLTTVPDLDRYLDGIERYHFGGTCYANNYHLYQLLLFLGYDVSLCGAGMSAPDVHIVNVVKIEGREFLVDAGYAAPFVAPLPRDLRDEFRVTLGRDEYVLSPRDASGRSRVTLYRDGDAHHGYLVNPAPRTIGEFGEVIERSFRPEATFMNAVLLVRFGDNSSDVLHNLTRIECRGTVTEKTELRTTEELIREIEDVFGIPSAISRIALNGLAMRRDAWS
jgi:arylamine N-acetyltransferase